MRVVVLRKVRLAWHNWRCCWCCCRCCCNCLNYLERQVASARHDRHNLNDRRDGRGKRAHTVAAFESLKIIVKVTQWILTFHALARWGLSVGWKYWYTCAERCPQCHRGTCYWFGASLLAYSPDQWLALFPWKINEQMSRVLMLWNESVKYHVVQNLTNKRSLILPQMYSIRQPQNIDEYKNKFVKYKTILFILADCQLSIIVPIVPRSLC